MGTIRRFSVGFDYVILEAGKAIYGVGANQYGQIASNISGDIAKPQLVPGFEKLHVSDLQAGSTFSAAVVVDGSLVVWGTGPFGKFEKPRKLDMPGVTFTSVRLSKFAHKSEAFGVGTASGGKVYAWGANQGGQLGTGDNRDRHLPEQITALKRKTITSVALGQSFVVMLGQDVSQEELQRKKERRRQMKREKAAMRAGEAHDRKSSKARSGHRAVRDVEARSTDAAESRHDRQQDNGFAELKLKQEYQQREKDYLDQIEGMRREVAHLKRLDAERDKQYESQFDEAVEQALEDQKRRLQDKFKSELENELTRQHDEHTQQR